MLKLAYRTPVDDLTKIKKNEKDRYLEQKNVIHKKS